MQLMLTRRRSRAQTLLVLASLALAGALVCGVRTTAVAAARVPVLQAPSMGAVALAGSAAVVAPEQQRVELVAPGQAPRVLAAGPGEPRAYGPTGEDFTQTLLRFAASGRALAYESASQASYKAGSLGLVATTAFGPLGGPYSPFPGSGAAACSAGYPDGAFLSEGAAAPTLPSGAFAVSGTRLATWPACTDADAIAVRNLAAPGSEVRVNLPHLAPTAGVPDEVAQLALDGETLAALVGTSNPHGVYPLAPYVVLVANASTGARLYTSATLPAGGALAVSAAGTAVLQVPAPTEASSLQASTYVITASAPAPRAIGERCISAYGVAIAGERVAQAVCGEGIVTTNLQGTQAVTVLALGAVPAHAFDYSGEASAAVRPACDGADELELASGVADPSPPPPTDCPASIVGDRGSVRGGRIRVRLRCPSGCAGTITVSHARAHASARFTLGPGGGVASIRATRPLLGAARRRHGARFAVSVAARTLSGATHIVRGAVRVRG